MPLRFLIALGIAAAALAQPAGNADARAVLAAAKLPPGVTSAVGASDLRLSFRKDGQAPLERINQWNATHRYTRAYVDPEGVHLDADLDTGNALPRAAIEAFVAGFCTAARNFAEEFAKLPDKASASRSRIGTAYGDFGLWINSQEWVQAENRGGTILFRQTHGDGYAMMITEPGMVPGGLEGLRKVIEANARKNTPDLHFTPLEPRKVNGHDVLVLTMEGTVSGIPLRYLGNAYSGPSGTIQVLTYTGKDLFDKSTALFKELLDGLEITETAGAPDGHLSLSSGKAAMEYDPAVWKTASARVGQVVLAHESGELYAQVISEGITMPVEKIVEVALANLQREAPDAAITSREPVTLNGITFLKATMTATVRKLELTYQNYYYAGPAGTIQIMLWTQKGKLAGRQAEIAAFLNGFRVAATPQ